MRWYEKAPERFALEKAELEEKYSSLSMAIKPSGYPVIDGRTLIKEAVVIEGVCELDPAKEVTSRGYKILILLPPDFPRSVPSLYCLDESLPRDIDRHILDSGLACLCVMSEARRFIPVDYSVVEFLDHLVHPFLVGQFHYECYGEWPWPDRSHGIDGIIEAYREMTGFTDLAAIRTSLVTLSRKVPAKGHWPCPCGSGKILRKCHLRLFRSLREHIYYRDAARDLEFLKKYEQSRKTQ